jgi:transcriptional regulator with XRE-family HTH domain
MDLDIGKRIKAIRLKKKMTLKQVAEKTELSISFLSQVERSQSSITLTSLKKVAEALGVSAAHLFPPDDIQKASIIRQGSRKQLQFHQSSFIYTNLSGDLSNPIFEPILATLLPGEKKASPLSHQGQEFGYVLEGVLTILLEHEQYELYPGDSIHIDSTTPHNWINLTNNPVKVLWVISPPVFVSSEAPSSNHGDND